MRRVLRPGGELIFCEYGQSPDEHILKWQNRLNPPWKKISGGCHLNRHIPELIKKNCIQHKFISSFFTFLTLMEIAMAKTKQEIEDACEDLQTGTSFFTGKV